jgi:hypothetical protein
MTVKLGEWGGEGKAGTSVYALCFGRSQDFSLSFLTDLGSYRTKDGTSQRLD